MTSAVKYGQIIEYIPGKLQYILFAVRCATMATCLPPSGLRRIDYLSVVKWAECVSDNNDYLEAIAIPAQATVQNKPFTLLIYIQDRLYLASYTTPPSADTLFPYPVQQPHRRSPSKRSAKAAEGPAIISDRDRIPPYYFSIDDTLLYNAFHHDFGPLHIGHLYRFAVQFHDILGAPQNVNKPVVFWSKADARSKCKLTDKCIWVNC